MPTETASPSDTATPIPTNLPLQAPMMGTESHSLKLAYVNLIKAANLTWVRRNAYLWSYVEPTEGERYWAGMAGLEKDMETGSANGIQNILIVRSTPPWAQKVRGVYCGPVLREKFGAFASFMHDLVARLSVPPYNVKYWELGNEPDVDPSLVPPDSVYGCWGDKDDLYYGGRYYGEMLSVVYPAIKSADPEAQVLIGGLLLDCDPETPPAGRDCTPSLFFNGILQNGGGEYFDIVSYHGYAYYNGQLSASEKLPNWAPRGGQVIGKFLYLRETLQNYGYNKPIYITEASLICTEKDLIHCNPPGDPFFEAQADYAVMLFARNWAYNLEGTIWFDFEAGWRWSSMLDKYHQPKPVYNSVKFFMQELDQAILTQPIGQYPQLNGYEFVLAEKRVWVLWAVDDVPHTITLPDNLMHIYDKYGVEISPTNGTLTIQSPVYIELSP
jgi:hypothetical protein